jgi:hypothetical protein
MGWMQSEDRGDQGCMENFVGETSWNAATLKTEVMGG